VITHIKQACEFLLVSAEGGHSPAEAAFTEKGVPLRSVLTGPCLKSLAALHEMLREREALGNDIDMGKFGDAVEPHSEQAGREKSSTGPFLMLIAGPDISLSALPAPYGALLSPSNPFAPEAALTPDQKTVPRDEILCVEDLAAVRKAPGLQRLFLLSPPSFFSLSSPSPPPPPRLSGRQQ